MTQPIHVISLGAGVQSSTEGLMAKHGDLTPMPDGSIFSDTQKEPRAVYEWLNKLTDLLSPAFPVYRVTHGNLQEEILKRRFNRKTGNPYYSTYIPAFVTSPTGKRGVLMRKCTYDFKLRPIIAKQRLLIAAHLGETALRDWRRKHKDALRAMREAKKNEQVRPHWAWQECQSDPLVVAWIGISLDEASRMKPSTEPWAVNRFPLIEKRMTRKDCENWLTAHGYPIPPKSACVWCPFHSDAMWSDMKLNRPDEFAEAVQFEKDFQAICRDGGATQTPFLHDSLKPLDEVVLNQPKPIPWNSPEGQRLLFPNKFENECEGMCGV
jgi:hypothetical protein